MDFYIDEWNRFILPEKLEISKSVNNQYWVVKNPKCNHRTDF